MALAPCVHSILCSLTTGVLTTLDGVVATQIATLSLAIAAAQAKILKYDVLLIPVQAANAVAQSTLATLRSAGSLVPSRLINDCADFGDITLNMQEAIDQASAQLNNLTQDLTRLLSIREELNALVEEYTQIIDELNEFRAVIQECLIEVADEA